jgi:hypothetical protein
VSLRARKNALARPAPAARPPPAKRNDYLGRVDIPSLEPGELRALIETSDQAKLVQVLGDLGACLVRLPQELADRLATQTPSMESLICSSSGQEGEPIFHTARVDGSGRPNAVTPGHKRSQRVQWRMEKIMTSMPVLWAVVQAVGDFLNQQVVAPLEAAAAARRTLAAQLQNQALPPFSVTRHAAAEAGPGPGLGPGSASGSARAGSGYRYRMSHPKLLANLRVPRQPPISIQILHIDLQPGEDGFSIILAVQACSVVVELGSHMWVRSSAGIGDHLLARWAAFVPRQVPGRVHLLPGDILVFDGNLVHAGDEATGDSPSLRIFWYVSRQDVLDELEKKDGSTYFVEMEDRKLAEKLLPCLGVRGVK